MMRKLLAALTAYLMLNIVPACAAGAADFGDVPDDYWAREEIQYVTDRGLFLGKTAETFAPDSGMTTNHDLHRERKRKYPSGYCNHPDGRRAVNFLSF